MSSDTKNFLYCTYGAITLILNYAYISLYKIMLYMTHITEHLNPVLLRLQVDVLHPFTHLRDIKFRRSNGEGSLLVLTGLVYFQSSFSLANK